MGLTMKNLMEQVNRVVMGTMNTPEEAIKHFIKNLIIDIKSLSYLKPKHKLSKVVPFQDRSIKYHIEEAIRFIDSYNELLTEKALEWASIAKRWQKPKDITLLNVLKRLSVKFQEGIKESFNQAIKTSESHRSDLLFMLENYNLTNKDIKKLEEMRTRLNKISKISYKTFIEDLKSGKIH